MGRPRHDSPPLPLRQAAATAIDLTTPSLCRVPHRHMELIIGSVTWVSLQLLYFLPFSDHVLALHHLKYMSSRLSYYPEFFVFPNCLPVLLSGRMRQAANLILPVRTTEELKTERLKN